MDGADGARRDNAKGNSQNDLSLSIWTNSCWKKEEGISLQIGNLLILEVMEMSQLLTIQQLANILQVEISTIRYWEKEFSQYLPKVDSKKRRKYSELHLDTFGQIKELLYTEQFTIKGAKRRLDLERTLTSALGIEQSLKSTVLFMFSAIMEELQKARQESRNLAKEIELLREQKENTEQRLLEEQNKSIIEFLKSRIGNKNSQVG